MYIWDSSCSPHNNALKTCEDSLNQFMHMNNIINVQSSKQVCKNSLWLKTSIATTYWLSFQVCTFRDHEETPKSSSKDNILMIIKLIVLLLFM